MSRTIAKKLARVTEARRTIAGALADVCAEELAKVDHIAWPDARYRTDPVGFARDIFRTKDLETGDLTPITLLPIQEDILTALARPRARVTVVSGHKCTKDFTASIAALWFLSSYPKARVRLYAPTDHQIDDITWREIRERLEHARIPLVDCPIPIHAETGLTASDFRELRGTVAKTAEGMAGRSGPYMLHILTEASGIPDEIQKAIEGNSAGGDTRILAISQGTRCSGWFYKSHHDDKEKKIWTQITISAWDVVEQKEALGIEIMGTATREWCEERRIGWGEDSADYIIRVLGGFAAEHPDSLIGLSLVHAAQDRWKDCPVLASDPLVCGVDPAWGGADFTAFCSRRGRKVGELRKWQEEDHRRNAEIVLQHVLSEMAPREAGALVRVDVGGDGWKLFRELSALVRQHDPSGAKIRVVPVHFSWTPQMPESYLRVRDELWGEARQWLRDGGALPPDPELEEDITTPRARQDPRHRLIVEDKKSIIGRLKRSPDKGDAWVLCVWGRREHREPVRTERAAVAQPGTASPARAMDPFAAMEAWR